MRRTLYEYINKTMYKEDIPTRNYTLPLTFTVSSILKLQLFENIRKVIILEKAVGILRDGHLSHFRDQKAFEIPVFEIPVFEIKPSSHFGN